MKHVNRMNIGRALMILGFAVSFASVGSTVSHIGDELFVLTAETSGDVAHSWHHFFREAFGDFGAMIGVCVLLWAPARARVAATWWTMAVLLVGFYAPFWAGAPLMPELAVAEFQHVKMVIAPLAALLVVRREYFRPEAAP